MLTRLDMSDEENVKDAQFELERAGDDPAKLAVWAGKWGVALVSRCLAAEGWEHDPDSEDKLQGQIAEKEQELQAVEETARAALKRLSEILERDGTPKSIVSDVREAVSELEGAL